jgi:Family of unknown function (DUF6492)
MIDIVTVVFESELPVLRLQAQSIDLYCGDLGTRSIYVVVNDSDSVAQQIDPTWWGSMSHLVRVVPRSMFSTEFVDNGWVSQQVLKILGASISYNTWSMVLDAKTIFVQDMQLPNLIDDQHRVRVGHMLVYPVFEPSRLIVNKLYEINLATQLGPGGVPHFFHNSTVRSMMVDTAELVSDNFPKWFQDCGMLTEFVLYAGYLKYKFGSFDRLYSIERPAIFPCNMCHSEVTEFETKLVEMARPQTTTVSIHRGAWSKLSANQQQQYRDLLVSKRISAAREL